MSKTEKCGLDAFSLGTAQL